MSIDASWPVLGRTDNATFYLADPDIIVVVPDDGCTDDESTARQSVTFQHAYWRSRGIRGAALVLMDRVSHQTKDARRVYQAEVDPMLVTAFGLVSGSAFGRAVASAFVGLTRPAVPTCMFEGLAEALLWAKAQHTAATNGNPDSEPRAAPTADPKDGNAT